MAPTRAGHPRSDRGAVGNRTGVLVSGRRDEPRAGASPALGASAHLNGGPDTHTASERQLFERWREDGDPHARTAIVERFLPLARQLARRYQRGSEPLDDLVQVASVGLVKAIDRFDVERNVAFSSYAVPTIVGELRRYFRDACWAVRVPRDLKELAVKVNTAIQTLSSRQGHAPSASELADYLDVTLEQVLEAMEASSAHRAIPLDRPTDLDDGAGEALVDALGDEDPGYVLAEHRATTRQLSQVLSPREREILRLRFVEDLTQSEIARRIGVSQMQVSRLIRRSLSRLEAAAEA
jgi:RNA polymerase sigma-B factor